MTTLREEIEGKLEHFWSAKTSYFSNEKYGFTECSNDIIKLIKKHGYISKAEIEMKIDIVLEEQSKYHADFVEGLHRLNRLL